MALQSFDEMVRDMGRTVIGTLCNATVVYRKLDATDRTITGHCQYRTEEPKDGRTRARYPDLHVSVMNDAVSGISGSEINTGGDKVLIAPRPGEPAKWMRIVRVVSQNAGLLILELQ